MEFGGYKIPQGALSSGRNQWGIAEPPGGYRPGASPEATIFLYADAVHKETIGDRLRHRLVGKGLGCERVGYTWTLMPFGSVGHPPPLDDLDCR